jgi:predicted CopG family antitoxin
MKKDKRMMAIEADVAKMLDESKKYQRETHSEVIRRLLNKQKGGFNEDGK